MVLNQFNTNFWDSRNLFDKFHNRELGHFVVKVSFSIGSNTTTQPRPQGFSLKKWVGKSPGDEVDHDGEVDENVT